MRSHRSAFTEITSCNSRKRRRDEIAVVKNELYHDENDGVERRKVHFKKRRTIDSNGPFQVHRTTLKTLYEAEDRLYHLETKWKPLNFQFELHRNEKLELKRQFQPKMRRKVVMWMFEVCDELQMDHNTSHTAILNFDRFIRRIKTIDQSQVQLVAIVSLLVAAKLHESRPPYLEQMLELCDHAYTTKNYCDMELLFMKILEWNVHISTPASVIEAIYPIVQLIATQINKSKPQLIDASLNHIACIATRNRLLESPFSFVDSNQMITKFSIAAALNEWYPYIHLSRAATLVFTHIAASAAESDAPLRDNKVLRPVPLWEFQSSYNDLIPTQFSDDEITSTTSKSY